MMATAALVEGTEPRFSFVRRKKRVTKIAFSAAEAGEQRWRWCFREAARRTKFRFGCETLDWPNRSVASARIRRIYLLETAENVRVHSELEAALSGANVILGAMPSAHAAKLFCRASVCRAGASFVSASKALSRERTADERSDRATRRSEIYAAHRRDFRTVFAGSCSREPTAVVLASRDAALAAELQEEFAGPNFRLIPTMMSSAWSCRSDEDVMAIAAGACQAGLVRMRSRR